MIVNNFIQSKFIKYVLLKKNTKEGESYIKNSINKIYRVTRKLINYYFTPSLFNRKSRT